MIKNLEKKELSLRFYSGFKSSDKCPYKSKIKEDNRKGEGNVIIESGVAATLSQECQEPPEMKEVEIDSSYSLQRDCNPAGTLTFDFCLWNYKNKLCCFIPLSL